ncbi:hypothetical protein [Rhizosaccharibacter radicis]|uniref:Signal transduction histidine kinase dimerisation/phosphoacceptor domain-containing protein n=1 Tax=Rhizosaccharibacter radicis TaxID=2782605 RepID=A0ABT1VVB4_9PROT|nr:hypothetical protein [Acetobacteraceae bacterium KSS12]
MISLTLFRALSPGLAALVVGLVLLAASVSPALMLAGTVLAALLVGMLSWRTLARLVGGAAVPPPAAPGTASAAVAEESGILAREMSSLRHDLRGILSPPLLLADRISGHEDQTVRRAAESMIAAIEKAEQRLGGRNRKLP